MDEEGLTDKSPAPVENPGAEPKQPAVPAVSPSTAQAPLGSNNWTMERKNLMQNLDLTVIPSCRGFGVM